VHWGEITVEIEVPGKNMAKGHLEELVRAQCPELTTVRHKFEYRDGQLAYWPDDTEVTAKELATDEADRKPRGRPKTSASKGKEEARQERPKRKRWQETAAEYRGNIRNRRDPTGLSRATRTSQRERSR
jgi:hypothetical protein